MPIFASTPDRSALPMRRRNARIWLQGGRPRTMRDAQHEAAANSYI